MKIGIHESGRKWVVLMGASEAGSCDGRTALAARCAQGWYTAHGRKTSWDAWTKAYPGGLKQPAWRTSWVVLQNFGGHWLKNNDKIEYIIICQSLANHDWSKSLANHVNTGSLIMNQPMQGLSRQVSCPYSITGGSLFTMTLVETIGYWKSGALWILVPNRVVSRNQNQLATPRCKSMLMLALPRECDISNPTIALQNKMLVSSVRCHTSWCMGWDGMHYSTTEWCQQYVSSKTCDPNPPCCVAYWVDVHCLVWGLPGLVIINIAMV